MLRSQMLEQLIDYLLSIKVKHPLRVAIDGIDTAGKSKLAKELAFPLRRTGRQIIHVSIDDFHNPQDFRYRRGSESPEGYYYDSFNYAAFIENILLPLGPDGDFKYRAKFFNLENNQKLENGFQQAAQDAILLCDGVFLMRPELFQYWDVRIFLDIQFETCIERAIQRDILQFGSLETIRKRYQNRYIPAQMIYMDRCHPKERADVLIENDDFKNPTIQFQRAVADKP